MSTLSIDLSELTPQQLVDGEKAFQAEIRHRMMQDEGGFLSQLKKPPEIPKPSTNVNET